MYVCECQIDIIIYQVFPPSPVPSFCPQLSLISPFLPPHLVLDHELMALHHDFELVPASLQLLQLLHSPTCHRTQQAVLAFSLMEEGLNLWGVLVGI